LKIGHLFAACGIAVPEGAGELDARTLVYDSRKAGPGAVFVAIPGFHRDGHEFIADAVTRGAVAVVAEKESRATIPVAIVPDTRTALADLAAELVDHPTRKLRVVGVTGTDGKTTTVHLISDVLEAAGERTGYSTTVDFKISDHAWENDTRQSTQEAVEIQEFFAELLVAGGAWGVLEATSHALALRKVRGSDVDIAVFTNLTPEHLDFHGTLQGYLDAKAILFEMLGGGADKGVTKTAVVNADDPHWRYLADRAAPARVLTYGIDAHADVQGTIVSADASGSVVRVATATEAVEVALPLVGRFNVHNALAAAAVGVAAGIPLATAKTALEKARPVRGRMERVDAGQPFTVIVDYAHTPESLDKVLSLLRPLTKGKLIAVFGSAGERDRAKRPRLAEVAGRYADLFVITQEDPRREDPQQILSEIEAGAVAAGKRTGDDFLVIGDRSDAVREAIRRAGQGDTVLLAGKGHEGSIIVGEEKIPWDEAGVARAALRDRGFAA
jgi:UDP-N-acetylmuramoyl-L-alanyl-D-glutamate--2,6-diaminopimelate ligase